VGLTGRLAALTGIGAEERDFLLHFNRNIRNRKTAVRDKIPIKQKLDFFYLANAAPTPSNICLILAPQVALDGDRSVRICFSTCANESRTVVLNT